MTERIIHTTTPEDDARLDSLAANIEAHKAEIVDRLKREERASLEENLAGQLRRAITDSMIGPEVLAECIGVDLDTFLAFQAGDRELPFGAFERLAKRLSLALVRSAETVGA
jgi:hypothetical protein